MSIMKVYYIEKCLTTLILHAYVSIAYIQIVHGYKDHVSIFNFRELLAFVVYTSSTYKCVWLCTIENIFHSDPHAISYILLLSNVYNYGALTLFGFRYSPLLGLNVFDGFFLHASTMSQIPYAIKNASRPLWTAW